MANVDHDLLIATLDRLKLTAIGDQLDEAARSKMNLREALPFLVSRDTSHKLADQLSEGLLDIAVLSTPPSHDNVALELLGRQTVDWIASRKLGLQQTLVCDEALLNKRIFATPAPSNLHSLTISVLAATADGGLRLNICNSLGTILNLVESGTGISILPTRLLQERNQSGTIQVLKTQRALPLQEVFMGTNKGAIVRALPHAQRGLSMQTNSSGPASNRNITPEPGHSPPPVPSGASSGRPSNHRIRSRLSIGSPLPSTCPAHSARQSNGAAPHENAIGSDSELEVHQAVAKLINLIITGGNSVRRA